MSFIRNFLSGAVEEQKKEEVAVQATKVEEIKKEEALKNSIAEKRKNMEALAKQDKIAAEAALKKHEDKVKEELAKKAATQPADEVKASEEMKATVRKQKLIAETEARNQKREEIAKKIAAIKSEPAHKQALDQKIAQIKARKKDAKQSYPNRHHQNLDENNERLPLEGFAPFDKYAHLPNRVPTTKHQIALNEKNERVPFMKNIPNVNTTDIQKHQVAFNEKGERVPSIQSIYNTTTTELQKHHSALLNGERTPASYGLFSKKAAPVINAPKESKQDLQSLRKRQ